MKSEVKLLKNKEKEAPKEANVSKQASSKRTRKPKEYKILQFERETRSYRKDEFEGQAVILFGVIANQGWLDLIQIQFIFFAEVALSIESSECATRTLRERKVWQFSQSNRMLLLTANRSSDF